MLIAWTTVASLSDAEQLARGAVHAGLAVCVQIEGPVASHYRWEGSPACAEEIRLCFKFIPECAAALEKWVLAHHPYDTPEWLVVRAENVSEKYLSWARSSSSNPPL